MPKTETIQIRVTSEEKQIIEKIAKALGHTPASYGRQRLLSGYYSFAEKYKLLDPGVFIEAIKSGSRMLDENLIEEFKKGVE